MLEMAAQMAKMCQTVATPAGEPDNDDLKAYRCCNRNPRNTSKGEKEKCKHCRFKMHDHDDFWDLEKKKEKYHQ